MPARSASLRSQEVREWSEVLHIYRHVFGDYQVLVAATPSPLGGFTAAVSVKKADARAGDNLFADFAIGGGERFDNPEAAMRVALDLGLKFVASQERPH